MSEPFPYQRIAHDLRERIVSGLLAEGARLPGGHELATRYGTTRTTVRKALALLQSEGRLASAQGRGVFVVRATGAPHCPTCTCQPEDRAPS